MPKVLNKYKDVMTENSISIIRPSKWGNPFVIGVDGSRGEVMKKYTKYIYENNDLLREAEKLKGKDLVCCCKPHSCHGDVLIKIANGE